MPYSRIYAAVRNSWMNKVERVNYKGLADYEYIAIRDTQEGVWPNDELHSLVENQIHFDGGLG